MATTTYLDRWIGAGRLLVPPNLNRNLLPAQPPQAGVTDARAMYAMLMDYYLNTGLYLDVSRAFHDTVQWNPAMQGLRNPAFAVVEFYVAHIWDGPFDKAFEFDIGEGRTQEAVAQQATRILEWSNWGQRRAVAVRWAAIFGDLFIKVAETAATLASTLGPGNPGRVYLQLIDPHDVTDFDTDERDFLTYVRLDTFLPQETNVRVRDMVRTEIWSKRAGTQQIWLNDHFERDREKLGTPVVTRAFEDIGIDFVPFTHGKFRDIGEDRGLGSFTAAKDPIDELNRQVTRLHQMMFRYNKPLMVITSGTDSSGRQYPTQPPPARGASGSATDGRVVIGDDDLWSYPGDPKIQQLVPNLNYAASLAAIDAEWRFLTTLLPELRYGEATEQANESGRALRFKLAPAIKRVIESRGNLEWALTQALAMGLTLGIRHNILDDVGTFEAGDFRMAFVERDVLPLSKQEEAEARLAEANAALALRSLGVSAATLIDELGYDSAVELAASEAQTAELGEQLLSAFERGSP